MECQFCTKLKNCEKKAEMCQKLFATRDSQTGAVFGIIPGERVKFSYFFKLHRNVLRFVLFDVLRIAFFFCFNPSA